MEEAQGQGYGGKGPQHFVKTRGVWQAYIRPRVLSGTMKYNNTTVPLAYNRISFYRAEHSTVVDIYHSFEYIELGTNSICHGRWYNMEVPLEEIQSLPGNTFTHVVESYELNEDDYSDDSDDSDDSDNRFVDATFSVTLSSTFAQEVRSLAHQGLSPYTELE